MKLEYYKWYKGEEILPEQMEDFCSNIYDDDDYLEPYFLVFQVGEPATAVRETCDGGKNWIWDYCYGNPNRVLHDLEEALSIKPSPVNPQKPLYWMAIREPEEY